MQIDMHFYGTYALARAAGLPPEVAKTVATAAQFVDDAIEDTPVLVDHGAFHVPVASCHGLLDTKNLKPIDQWHVWLPYHFLPGNKGRNAEERLICRAGDEHNDSANAIIDFALRNINEPFGPHLLGIVTHVLQDTYSHAGFLGISSRYNNVIKSSIDIGSITDPELLEEKSSAISDLVELLHAPGHAAVGCLPDYPYLTWSFEYEHGSDECPRSIGGKTFQRSNPEVFAAACQRLHGVFVNAGKTARRLFSYKEPNKSYAECAEDIQRILSTEAKHEERGALWDEALRRGSFCDPEAEDNDVVYDELAWRGETDGGAALQPGSDPVLFMQASHLYRAFVHGQLLPGLMPRA
jgi:hypothetical protein